MSERLFYMAPLQNAPLIALAGILSFNKRQACRELDGIAISIADPFVNHRRHGIMINERSLHDYVPLYWATHTPMQYVVTQRDGILTQSKLVFFVLDSEQILELPGVWTTDGNAASPKSKFFEGDGALPFLDWNILRTRDCYSPEYKRKKCAEVLVPDRVSSECFREICVFEDETAARLREHILAIQNPAKKKRRVSLNPRAATIVTSRQEFYYNSNPDLVDLL